MSRNRKEIQGEWLFRWRSYLPLIFVPFAIIALRDSGLIGRLTSEELDTCWELFCLALSIGGLVVRGITIGYVPKKTSGRNTRNQIAAELNTTGMYSIVRNPLYLGNFIIFLGMLLFIQVLWLVVLGVSAFWLYYERIIAAEEAFLEAKFGEQYITWAEKTPPFFPRFRNWTTPALSFSLKNVLKREYTGFFVIDTSFTLLDIAEDFLGEGVLEVDDGWLGFFIFGMVAYLTLRAMKRKTRILHVKGR